VSLVDVPSQTQESLKASAPEHKHKIKVVSSKIGKAAKGAASASGKAAKAVAKAGAGVASFVFDRRKPVSLPVRPHVHVCTALMISCYKHTEEHSQQGPTVR
jgi:hypothetical protein